jgi:hypothetical protein
MKNKTKTETDSTELKNASEKAQPFIAVLNTLLSDPNSKITPEILEDAETTYLVIGPGYYGYGNTLKQAYKNCTDAGCSRKHKRLAYVGDDSVGVNDFGQVSANRYLISLGEI